MDVRRVCGRIDLIHKGVHGNNFEDCIQVIIKSPSIADIEKAGDISQGLIDASPNILSRYQAGKHYDDRYKCYHGKRQYSWQRSSLFAFVRYGNHPRESHAPSFHFRKLLQDKNWGLFISPRHLQSSNPYQQGTAIAVRQKEKRRLIKPTRKYPIKARIKREMNGLLTVFGESENLRVAVIGLDQKLRFFRSRPP
jgi:hypothetical protein